MHNSARGNVHMLAVVHSGKSTRSVNQVPDEGLDHYIDPLQAPKSPDELMQCQRMRGVKPVVDSLVAARLTIWPS